VPPPALAPDTPAAEPPATGAEVARRLTASKVLIGLLIAIVGAFAIWLVIGVAFAAAGADQDGHGFDFAATFAGDGALVLAAYFLTADLGRPTWATFGLRRFRPSGLGWVALAFVSYLVLAAIYTQLVNPPPEDLPEQLGADESTLLAVVTGVFVMVVAPFAEEFFFRGFLYQGLRNSWGMPLGVLASGAIFSGIHAAPDKFVPLAILGIALALVFEKTRSLWACIILHAINNALAFVVSF
jgi:membrane protease YdiL (CAAX protease family)